MRRPIGRAPTALALLAVLALIAAMPPAGAAAGPDRLLAPPRACPGQGNASAPPGVQGRAMRCLTNFAREKAGMPAFDDVSALDRSARLKSGDMVRCDDFDHEACGREFTYWMRRTGYLEGGCWRAAENIAVGTGRYATPRSIFRGWLHSSGHRENILGHFDDIGVGLRVGTLGKWSGAHVWTQHFGSRC